MSAPAWMPASITSPSWNSALALAKATYGCGATSRAALAGTCAASSSETITAPARVA